MAKPDLTAARRQVAKLMDATCTVTFDAEGTSDDMLDEITLERIVPDPDAPVVYSGPCLIVQTGTGRTTGLETVVAGQQEAPVSYKVRVPHDADEIPRGSVVTVNTSERDPQLADLSMRVVVVERTSFLVWRTLQCEAVT